MEVGVGDREEAAERVVPAEQELALNGVTGRKLRTRVALPGLPMLAALSAGHLSAVRFPESLRRLFVLVDRDPAGEAAVEALATRAAAAGIEVVAMIPVRGDFNDDLRAFGLGALREAVRGQLRPGDAERFLGR